MKRRLHTLLLFVDGLGMGSDDPQVNPVIGGACPCLQRLLTETAKPIDAQLGVTGIPQSATGQTALLTGINAAQVMGRHVEAFPGPALRTVIEAHNIFRQLAALGLQCTFANAYYVDDIAEVARRHRLSVTTVAAWQAFRAVRDAAHLRRDQAVYQDLTRETLRSRGYEGPLIAPREAARHLLDIAAANDFTLFEYFLTDRIGHRGEPEAARRILAQFDEFLCAIEPWFHRPRRLLLLTSDHGNLEDLRTHMHTANPVPFVAVGAHAAWLRRRIASLVDVTPAIVALYRRWTAREGFDGRKKAQNAP
jgi:hypothetical protein